MMFVDKASNLISIVIKTIHNLRERFYKQGMAKRKEMT